MPQPATEWRAEGACLTADPDLFFPIATGYAGAAQVAKAQQVCARCAVRQQCLDFAMRTGEADGIWGGTTPEERTRARRQAAARRRRRSPGPWQRTGTRDARASLSPGPARAARAAPLPRCRRRPFRARRAG